MSKWRPACEKILQIEILKARVQQVAVLGYDISASGSIVAIDPASVVILVYNYCRRARSENE